MRELKRDPVRENPIKAILKVTATSLSLIIVVAFAMRVGCLWMAKRHAPTPFFDVPYGYETGHIARSITLGKGFSSPLSGVDTGPTAWLTPAFPYLLAGVFKLFGIYTYTSFLVIVTIDCLFSALACVPIFFIGKRLDGLATGAIAAWIWALFPVAIIMPLSWVWDTCLSTLVVGLIVWATLAVCESNRARHWAAYGLLWAFGLMVNPAILSVLPFLLLWLALQLRKENRQWLKLPAMAALLITMGCIPWTARNYLTFHKLVPLRSNFGLELWLGNNSQVTDTLARWLHPDGYPPERQKFVQMGEIAYMQAKQHEAVQFIVSHPRDEMRFLWHRFMDNWTGTSEPIPDIWRFLSWQGQLTLGTNILVSLLSMAGLLLLFRRERREAWLFAVFPAVYPAIYYVTHTSARYRHPIDPILCVLTAFSIGAASAAFARRFSRAKQPAFGAGARQDLAVAPADSAFLTEKETVLNR
jgi:4-amino-4-deoxy-L-arabinose transferase-like glycosyltransferase